MSTPTFRSREKKALAVVMGRSHVRFAGQQEFDVDPSGDRVFEYLEHPSTWSKICGRKPDAFCRPVNAVIKELPHSPPLLRRTREDRQRRHAVLPRRRLPVEDDRFSLPYLPTLLECFQQCRYDRPFEEYPGVPPSFFLWRR